MYQPNLPKKTVASVHVAIVCLLIVLGLIFSFLPIIKIRTNDKNTASGIISIVHKFGGNISLEDLDEIKVSAPKLLRSTLLIVDVMKVTLDGGKATTEDKAELREKMEGKDGKDAILICAAIVYTVTDAFKSQEKNESQGLINILFNVLITIVVLLYLLGMTVAMPILLIILAVKALIPVIKNFHDLHMHTATVANKLPEKLSIILTVMLFQCVLPSVSYGSGTLALLIVTVICVFTNFVCTRLITYDKKEFIYLNIVQGSSLLTMIGFFIFFANILKTDIFSTFTHGSWGRYVARILSSSEKSGAPKGYIVDALLIAIYLVAVLLCVKILPKCANRFSCAWTAKPKKATALPESCVLLLAYILPKIVAKRESQYLNPFDKSSGVVGSFLKLGAEQKTALNAVLIGVLIMIASEIALIVLDKEFCFSMSDEAKASVLSNTCEPFVFEDLSEIKLPPIKKESESTEEETPDSEYYPAESSDEESASPAESTSDELSKTAESNTVETAKTVAEEATREDFSAEEAAASEIPKTSDDTAEQMLCEALSEPQEV